MAEVVNGKGLTHPGFRKALSEPSILPVANASNEELARRNFDSYKLFFNLNF
jgi:hypothetical protein